MEDRPAQFFRIYIYIVVKCTIRVTFSVHIQLALLHKLSSTISKSGPYDKPSRNVIKVRYAKGIKGSQTI